MLPVNAYGFVSPFTKTAPFGAWPSTYGREKASSLFSRYVVNSRPYEQYLKSAATGIANFLLSAQDVQEAARKLTKKDTSPFQVRKAESSNAGKVTAKASEGAALRTYRVKVNAVAASQENRGALLAGSDPSAIGKGTNVFKIKTGGKTTSIQVNITENDTNEQALNKLKDAINATKTGVTATVETDKETGKKQLVLRSDKTGTDHAFEVEDETGNAMAAAGVIQATRQASNASYSINGGPVKTSQSNIIELEPGKVTATLMETTADDVVIRVQPDGDRIVSDVKELVTNYNRMIGQLKAAGGYLSPSIQRSLDNLVNSSAYEQIGIYRNADGTLRLAEDQLLGSLSSRYEMAANTIGGRYGLADRIASAAERYNTVPPSSLLNTKTHQMQQLLLYQSSMQMVMSGQFSGWIVNLLY